MGRPLRQMSQSPGEMGQVAHPLLQNLVSSLSCDFAVGAGFSMDGRGKHTPGDRTMLQTPRHLVSSQHRDLLSEINEPESLHPQTGLLPFLSLGVMCLLKWLYGSETG